jgi:hypothetical protein
MLRRFGFLLVCLASGCSDTPKLPDLDVAVVDAVGGNPLTGRAITTVRARHREGTAEFSETMVSVEDGTFDLLLPISDFALPSELRFELSSVTGTELVGSTPEFYPGEGYQVEIVVGVPATCDVVTASQLPVERRAFGTVTLGTFALLIGGIELGGTSKRIGFHDLLLHTAGAHAFDLPEIPGRSRAAAISRTSALVISEGAAPFTFNLYARGDPRKEITLHDGARRSTAVLAAGTDRAVVVGGLDGGGQPVTGVSFVAEDGTVTGGALNTPHANRVAAYAADGVYVVSRGLGAAALERIPVTGGNAIVLIASIADGVRNGATLFFRADGAEGLLVGGTDENGTPRTDTVRFTGCPDACAASAGPTWTTARATPMTDPAGFLVGGAGPSTLVERVVFGDAGPVFVSVGQLENARFDGGLLTHPSGALIVFGGEGTSGIRRDVEMCFPPSID